MCDVNALPLDTPRTCDACGCIEVYHPWTGVAVRVCERCYRELYQPSPMVWRQIRKVKP